MCIHPPVAALALAATGALRSLLDEVQPLDPASFAAGAAVLLAIVLRAASVPASRAAAADPVVTLRTE